MNIEHTHTQNERRDKTGSTIDRVSGPSEMKLTIIIQQVNDDTEKKEEEKRLQSRKYCETTATKKKKKKKEKKKSRHAAKVFWASTIHMAVVLVFSILYFSFLVQFLRFHSSDEAYACFLFPFLFP